MFNTFLTVFITGKQFGRTTPMPAKITTKIIYQTANKRRLTWMNAEVKKFG
jgi:hypothetical protein